MLDLSKSMVTCSIVGDAYENRWWYIALLVGYKATAEHYRGSEQENLTIIFRNQTCYVSVKISANSRVYVTFSFIFASSCTDKLIKCKML